MFPTFQDMREIAGDEQAAISCLKSKGVFEDSVTCSRCGIDARFTLSRKSYRCTTKTCRHERSIMKNTFSQSPKLPVNQILELVNLWLKGIDPTAIHHSTGHAWATVTHFCADLRTMVGGMLEDCDTVIGGPGIVVEIDETKMGKRKYHRGHRVEGVWVFGGVERTPERKFFAMTVSDRTAETLVPLIQRHIHPGSIVHSDCWAAYNGLESQGLVPRTVNHSRFYK